MPLAAALIGCGLVIPPYAKTFAARLRVLALAARVRSLTFVARLR